ncbi:MAG: hypothetical protein KUL88_21620 [Rhizobium sp.]|nr:hypothetical protein [Rhizobium sp.]
MPEHHPRSRPPLWRRLGPAERALALALVLVALGGLLLIADGLYIKVKAADALASSDATSLRPAGAPPFAAGGSGPGPAPLTIKFLRPPLAKPVSAPR